MGYEDDIQDTEAVSVNAPVFCPSCNTALIEGESGNRVCKTNFPPCCYVYWNALERRHYWKDGYGSDDVYNTDQKIWTKKEPTEKAEVSV